MNKVGKGRSGAAERGMHSCQVILPPALGLIQRFHTWLCSALSMLLSQATTAQRGQLGPPTTIRDAEKLRHQRVAGKNTHKEEAISDVLGIAPYLWALPQAGSSLGVTPKCFGLCFFTQHPAVSLLALAEGPQPLCTSTLAALSGCLESAVAESFIYINKYMYINKYVNGYKCICIFNLCSCRKD